MKTPFLLVAAVALAAPTTGCHEDWVRARAASELGCSERDVSLTPLGSGGYIADGCGQTMHLSCDATRHGAFCVTDGAPTPTTETQPAYDQNASSRRTPPADDHAALGSALTNAANDAADVCGDVAGPRGPGEATMTLVSDGRVAGVQLDPPYEGTPVGDCVVSQLGRVRVRPFSGQAIVLKKNFEVGSVR